MATIAENRETWDGVYSWESGGEEWSKPWGSTAVQWSATIAPRVRPFLPADLIVEIAPGAGRWTPYLLDHCKQYVGIDLSKRSVDVCRQRFGDRSNARFETTDGRSLPTVEDRSVDLCFSFDSLVHADPEAIAGYLAELARVLSANGIAFIHHSNRGGLGSETSQPADRLSWRIDQLRRWTMRQRVLADAVRRVSSPTLRQRVWRTGWRSESMSASAFEQLATAAGLCCIGQELISWEGTHRLIDCISLAALPTSRWSRSNVVVRNHAFVDEAVSAGLRASVFDTLATSPHDRRM